MTVRHLAPQPLTSYDQQMLNLLGMFRLYRSVQPAYDPNVVHQNVLYQSQFDTLKSGADLLYSVCKTTIASIRGIPLSFNPLYTIDPISPLQLYGLDAWVPSSEMVRLKTSNYSPRYCRLSGEVVFPQLGGQLTTRITDPSLSPNQRPDPVWPPWPPLPPPSPPPLLWVPAVEQAYSKCYAYYWLLVNLYNAPPFNAYDFRTLSYFSVEYWKNFHVLYRYANNEANYKNVCLVVISAIAKTFC